MRFRQICFSVRIPELLGPMFCMRLSESGSFVLPAQAFCLQIEGSFPTFHTQGPTVGRIPMISNSYTWLVLAIRGSYITGKRRQEGILRSGPRIVQGPGPTKSPQRGPPRDCGCQLACPAPLCQPMGLTFVKWDSPAHSRAMPSIIHRPVLVLDLLSLKPPPPPF